MSLIKGNPRSYNVYNNLFINIFNNVIRRNDIEHIAIITKYPT